MRRVFLDTVGLLALWNRNDQWHDPAVEAMRAISAENADGFASEVVLLECGNAAARTGFRDEVISFRKDATAAGLVVIPTEAELEKAWTAYKRRAGGGAGIVDQISFVLMRRLGISEAFTNDEHFRAAGFVTLF